MNAKEKISYLFDKDSINLEVCESKSGFLLGFGTIEHRKTYFIVFNKDEKPSSLFSDFERLNKFLKNIHVKPAPLVLMMDIPSSHQAAQKSPFPDDAEKLLASENGVGNWYYNHATLSGKVPQTCVVFDKMGAALTFPIALCDTATMIESAGMSIGRLDVVSKILHKDLEYDELGGARLHAEKSASIDWVAHDESSALAYAKKYLSYLPEQSGKPLPQKEFTYSSSIPLEYMIPNNPLHTLDMDVIVDALCDDNSFLELKKSSAKEIITGFATFNGHVAGVMANRSKENSGIFFPHTSQKASRFISLCDAFGIPIVFLSDAPGFMVGGEVESAGSIKSAAQLFSTISNATTAKYSIAMRRTYTAGLYAMGGGGLMPDRFVALPSAIISIYGEAVAKQLMQASDDEQKEHANKIIESSHAPQHFLDMGLIDKIVKYDELRDDIISFVSKYQDGKRSSKRAIQII
ncbi:MAG: carboxyl transferase domain-containing protein [Campylobacterota bacterium]|nr:carboxyl transferase domain-containing protein [Campylobacterota bacterium]